MTSALRPQTPLPPQTPRRPEWVMRPCDADLGRRLATELRVSPALGHLMAARGYEDVELARRHVEAPLKNLHDPFLLPDLRAAAERVVRAVREGETILVHGDYDVDGVTGTALLVRMIGLIGGKAEWHIPNRFTDGYSFGEHSLKRAEGCGAKLVISVDNGTSAHETIEAFVERGVDVIVTDHHEPTPDKDLPPAIAIVNPKLDDSQYPFRELCGGAVAFKLAWGVAQTFEGTDRVSTKLREFLVEAMSYVAIATVCDVVPLIDENRILARWGLKSLATTNHPGLSALLDVAGLGHRRLTGEDVGFKIGPRLNASGRLGTAEAALEVLLCEDPSEAKDLAKRLDDLNETRREIERGVLDEARAAVDALSEEERKPVLVVAGQGWHQGVVGIVAARLVDEHACPAIVIGLDGEEGRGSARSVAGFSVLDAMHGGGEHMIRYGGHEQAAGCEIRADAIDALRGAVRARADELLAESAGTFTAPPLDLDAELPFESLTPEFMKELDRLEPFGPGNESALFVSRDLRLAEPARRVGADKTHLMLRLRRGDHAMRAMAFGLGARADELQMGMPIEAVFHLRWNTFHGRTNLELQLKDFRVSAV